MSLCCSDPLGTEGMDPWWCPERDRLRRVAAVSPACFGTQLEGLTCLWTPVWLGSRTKRTKAEIWQEGLAGLKLSCRPPNQIAVWEPWWMQGAVRRVWPRQRWWSEPWRAGTGHHPRCSEGRAACSPTCCNLLKRSCSRRRCRPRQIQTRSPSRRTCRLLWQRRPRYGRSATATTTRREAQNESSAPPRLQTASPGTDACIQDPGAGNFLQRRWRSWWLAEHLKGGLGTHLCAWSSGTEGRALCSGGSGWKWDPGRPSSPREPRLQTGKRTGLEDEPWELLRPASLRGGCGRRWASGEPSSLRSLDNLCYASAAARGRKIRAQHILSLIPTKVFRTHPWSLDTRGSPSSLPRNPLAKGLFSIFSWVI